MFVCQWHSPAMAGSQFRPHSEALAPYVVVGSQRWVVSSRGGERWLGFGETVTPDQALDTT